MKTPFLPIVAVCALAALAACKPQPEVLEDAPSKAFNESIANLAPVELPPAIKESKTFRCKDNTLVYVEFTTNPQQVNLRTEPTGLATVLKAPAEGEPFVAEGGYKLTGNPKTVTVTVPGKPERSCNA